MDDKTNDFEAKSFSNERSSIVDNQTTGLMKGFWHWLSDVGGQAMLAGAAGGLVRSITLREKWTEGLGSLVVGALCALYASPVAYAAFEPVVGRLMPGDSSIRGFSGFISGIVGMAFVGFVLDVWKSWRSRKVNESKLSARSFMRQNDWRRLWSRSVRRR